ncbi:MAG: hypothetical protein DRI69_05745 [Bacteroidetes bacterium]|nr:MAG: hypothetical protein DRI69_05745 [Bacteroidota bacterium]
MEQLKIVCHGDSLTEGYDIDLTVRWTDLLQQQFVDAQIINSGISGDTTAGMLARFKPMVIDHEPTHVIIMGGTNDVAQRIPFDLIISNIHAMTRQARHFGITSIIGLPTPVFVQEDMSYNVELSLMQEFALQMIKYNARLKQFAEADDWTVIDFGKSMHMDAFLNDGVHPNEDGQIVMMHAAKEVLLNLSIP